MPGPKKPLQPRIPDHPDLFRRLVEIMARLRAPDGCPWDHEQTHQSLKKYLIEESHEVLEAIDDGNDEALRSELGDIALQVVFHAQIASEEGRFDINDVLRAICEKMIYRHPHVFGDKKADSAEEVLVNWEKIKKTEKKKDSAAPASAVDGVPRSLPALHRSERVQEKVSRVGFDWANAKLAFPKIEEEIRELRESIDAEEGQRQEEELGDLLFAIVNYARLRGFHAEGLLSRAVDKFERRFRQMERILAERGEDDLSSLTLEQMDEVWDEVKKSE